MSLAIVRGEHASVPPDQDPDRPEWLRRQLHEFIDSIPLDELEIAFVATMAPLPSSRCQTRLVSIRVLRDHEAIGMAYMAAHHLASDDRHCWNPPTPETGPEKPEEPA